MLLTYVLYLLVEIVLVGGLVYTLPNNTALRKRIGDRALDIAVGVILAYGILCDRRYIAVHIF